MTKLRRRAYVEAPLNTPEDLARMAREAEAKATKIRASMEVFDNLPAECRRIAREFTMKDIVAARKMLGFEYPLSDEQWGKVEAFLNFARRRKQEDIYARGLAAY